MKECPTCTQSVPESARFCSTCRFDFAALEATVDDEIVQEQAEGRRAVRDFIIFGAAIAVIMLIALRLWG